MTRHISDPDQRITQRDIGVDRTPVAMRAVVVTPDFQKLPAGMVPRSRTPDQQLEEAIGLALAIDLEIVASQVVPVARIQPATLIGSGKVEEIAELVHELEAGLVIVDAQLSPIQQRNLERDWKAKVLDRTGLILEIFGRRAQTKEGALQVELAHLNYQRGRLVRSWTHLERQRGGAGFLGGPGETQIEADRRILRDKIKRLETDLEQVRRTRTLHRSKRKKVPLPVVAFVGYTNAGKSTLFNRLTGADVMAEDMLFATLDPTLRRLRLPGGSWVILSDTVGFISDLPTHLVAAFRATLEEVQEADLVLHVRDAADPQAMAQMEDVEAVLNDLGVSSDDDHLIEVLNKIDLLDEDARETLLERSAAEDQHRIGVSALTGVGIERLLDAIERKISGVLIQRKLIVSVDRFVDVAWLHENAIIVSRSDHDDGSVEIVAQMSQDTSDAYDRRSAA